MAGTLPKVAPIPAAREDKIALVANVLKAGGFPADSLSLCVTQAMFESGWLGNLGSKSYNNLTGIKVASSASNVAFQRALGVTASPKLSPEGNPYAVYPSLTAWAKDYLRVLNMNKGKGSPVAAKTPGEFVDRLLANGYASGQGHSNYRTGFASTHKGVADTLKKLGKKLVDTSAALLPIFGAGALLLFSR